MAKIGKASFKGASGKTYSFNVWPIETSFLASGAVYCITRRYKNSDGDPVHAIIYVGVTEDLSTRFDDHHKDACFTRHKANCICIHSDEGKASRLAKEADLIEKIDPPCNG